MASEASTQIKNKLSKSSFLTAEEIKADIYFIAACGTRSIFDAVFISICERCLNYGCCSPSEVQVAVNNGMLTATENKLPELFSYFLNLYAKPKEWAEYFVEAGVSTLLTRATVSAEGKFGETKTNSTVRSLLSDFAQVCIEMDRGETKREYRTDCRASFDTTYFRPPPLSALLASSLPRSSI